MVANTTFFYRKFIQRFIIVDSYVVLLIPVVLTTEVMLYYKTSTLTFPFRF